LLGYHTLEVELIREDQNIIFNCLCHLALPRAKRTHTPQPVLMWSDLPCELHGLIYCYLEWRDKKSFISLSKDIYSNSRSYRELKLNKRSSLDYILKESFRERISTRVLLCHVRLLAPHCRYITDTTLTHLGDIHTLKLSCCSRITDEGLRHLGRVHTLDLSSCGRITDAGVAYLGNIHNLNLFNCGLLTDAATHHLGRVHTLDLSYCNRITDAGLAHLGGIHTLKLVGCVLITDAGLASLGGVHTLDLSNCHQITDLGLSHLCGVHTLNISFCPLITNTGHQRLKEYGVDVHRLLPVPLT
jgi:hypothetical protein